MKFFRKTTFACIAAMALASSCATSCGEESNIIFGDDTEQGTVTPSSHITARMETPRPLGDGSTVLAAHSTDEAGGRRVMTYCLEYDKSKLHSRWIAFRFDGDTRERAVSRSNEPFADDPEIDDALHIGRNGFGSGYDRGHLCASADRLYSTAANENTFFMTNMSPQLSSFNQGYWVTFEGYVQKLGRNESFSDTLYVVKGGTVKDNQIKTYLNRPNGTRVAVPKYYYMALLKVKNGVYSSIAFWMEHKEYGYSNKDHAPRSVIATHAVSVNRLEELTGIDFFYNLPDAKEEEIEDQLFPANWNL